MSRYIEQEHIGRAISNLPTEIFSTENSITLVLSATEVIDAIKDAPSIGIVRCRECKAYDSECEWCGGLGLGMKPDDFCSYGSRSEKPNNSERSSE